jgi:hypothetical protein
MAKRYTPAMVDLLNKAMEYSKTKYPSMPDYARPKPSYKTTDANGLTKAIVEWIDLSGGWATRISTEGRYIESLGKRIPSSVKKGTSDIHAVWKGMHLSIEVKIGADRQSPEQKAIEADIKAAGGHYFIAKDFDTFYNWITTL